MWDISGAMVGTARGKVEEIGQNWIVLNFFQADLCDLSEIPKETYGLAVAMGDPIGCTKSPAKALKEIRKTIDC